jgi:uncharacterized protein (TIGR00661 family)
MNILFVVHGNGNGHQTQAISLKEELESRGHHVSKCLLTSSGNTRQGNLLEKEFEDFGKIAGFELKYKKGVLDFPKTVLGNIVKFPRIVWAMNQINNMVHFYCPDLVVSFYDPIYQLAEKIYGLKVPYVSVGHMYMFEDRNFGFHEYDSRFSFLKIYNRLTCLDAKSVYSLSYFPSSNPNLNTVGPILRNSILNSEGSESDHHRFSGYFHHLCDAQKFSKSMEKYPAFSGTIFSNTKKKIQFSNTTILPIDKDLFVSEVSKSQIFVSSSGFESTSESLFLGKKILTIPIQNHIEQELNAKCLEEKGLVFPLYSWENLDDKLSKFLFDFVPNTDYLDEFRNFTKNSRLTLVKMIEQYADRKAEDKETEKVNNEKE